jgi:capsular polysaccharide biosynthesis protein
MALREYVRLLRRWSWLILLGAVVAGAIAYLISRQMVPIYAASTTLLSTQVNAIGSSPDFDSLRASESLARTYVELMRKRPVLEAAIANLNLQMDTGELADNLTVRVIPNTQLMTLMVEDTDPVRAASIANELVRVFIAQNQERQAQRYAASKQSLERELARIRWR